jgi:tetratricopeptide (TPR) repeat protein
MVIALSKPHHREHAVRVIGVTLARPATAVLAAVLALQILAPGASALGQAPCKINDGSPFQVNGAKQYVLAAANSRNQDEIPKHLSNAIRVLTDNPEKINNEAGRQFLLVRTYAQWLKRDGATFEMRRGSMGFTQNPNGSHNLLLALDSAVVGVERVMPECAGTVRPYRNEFLTELYNRSVAAMNADKLDSAVVYSKLSQQLAGTDPRPWNVLSAVYQKANKPDSAMLAMAKVIELAKNDSTFTKVKQQSRYNLAVLQLQQADVASGSAKTPLVASARELLQAYLVDSPGDAAATQALGRAMRLSGDTAAVGGLFASMIATPDRFTADQLFEAASNAAGSGRDGDAVTLFEAGLRKNPWHRVALLNVSNVLFQLKNTDKMGPVTERLVRVDPNNPDSWRMRAGYWQTLQRAEADAAKKKAYGDSTVAAIRNRDAVSPRVQVFLATRRGTGYQVQGSVTNETDKAASYTITFELLDDGGAPVATKDVAVGPVDAGGNATFDFTVENPKAVAWRYAPVK